MELDLTTSLLASLTPGHLAFVIAGLIGGIVIGALPGLSATMGVTLLMPFTLLMPPETGLIMLGAVFVGAIYGGSNSAILLNIPGTPSALATTFDGYPLARQGRARHALIAAVCASVVGGVFGTLVLFGLLGPLAQLGLMLGPAEFMWLGVLGLTTIVSISSASVAKGVMGAVIGCFMGTVGLSQFTAEPRFTFGSSHLSLGLGLIPVLVGLFAVTQVLILARSSHGSVGSLSGEKGVFRWVVRQMARAKLLLLRSSIIGVIVGMLPGAGGEVAAMIAYNESKRAAADPGSYGTGEIRGVITSESANNAQVPGTLIPMLGLGIPGSAVAAVMMGGLLAHGIVPGPDLMKNSGDVAYTFIFGLLIANILLLPIGYLLLQGTSTVLRAPVKIVIPVILVLGTIGSLAPRGQVFDVVVMVVVGLGGYLLHRVGVEAGPIALGLVLGPIIENNLTVGLNLAESAGSVASVLILRPVSIVLILFSIFSLVYPIWRERRHKRSSVAVPVGGGQ